MNTTKATQEAKRLGFGKVFIRENGEICLTNKSGKVILAINPDWTIRFNRWDMTEEAAIIKSAILSSNNQNAKSEKEIPANATNAATNHFRSEQSIFGASVSWEDCY
jgi:hypothetical protein